MIHLVTYADEKMTRSKELCISSAKKMGVDASFEIPISEDFKEINKEIFSHERGAGFWLWKSYLIYKAMTSGLIEDGEILIYSDAGVEFIAPVQEIISRMDEDIFFFTNGWLHKEWCKGDIMRTINGWHVYDRFDQKQIQASVIFFRVNQKTRDFVKEWLLWCQFPGFITDEESKVPNCETFAENRHDQAILTAVAIKHGYTIDRWWPTEYSMHLPRSERDNYPCMFRHHRKRNNEW